MKIWLCDLTYDQLVIAADSIPTNIGYIASYLQSRSSRQHEIRLFKYPGKLIAEIEAGNLPDIVGFTHFMWNARLSLALAAEIKDLRPETAVVFGGLNYPIDDRQRRSWLAENPCVDFHVVKEGEVAFHGLVEAMCENAGDLERVKTQDLTGVHYLRDDGGFHAPPPAPRVRDLCSFPSPYLTGLLDEFFDGRLYPMLTTNRGCPFRCTFCAEGQDYYNTVNKMALDRVLQEIDYIARKVSAVPRSQGRRDLFITDSNFGMYKQDVLVAKALSEARVRHGWPDFVKATTGKNMPDRVLETARALDGAISLTGSVQSLDPAVLENIRRKNLRTDDLIRVATESRVIGSHSYSDVILGLPGDSYDRHRDTVAQTIDAGFDTLTLYQLRLQADCEMATAAYRCKFGLKGRFRVFARSVGSYTINGRRLNVAEIEEVCVEGTELPYSDYVKAREFDLIVAIFYFEGIFEGVLKFLASRGLRRFGFIEAAERICRRSPVFQAVLHEFAKDTERELIVDFDGLSDDLTRSEEIDRYLREEKGINVLGYHRIRVLSDHFDDVAEVAFAAAVEVLEKASEPLVRDTERFLSEIIKVETEIKRGRFQAVLEADTASLEFDVPRFLATEEVDGVEGYRLDGPRTLRFERSDHVAEIINKNAGIFGASPMGHYQQATRVPWKRVWRHARWTDEDRQAAPEFPRSRSQDDVAPDVIPC